MRTDGVSTGSAFSVQPVHAPLLSGVKGWTPFGMVTVKVATERSSPVSSGPGWLMDSRWLVGVWISRNERLSGVSSMVSGSRVMEFLGRSIFMAVLWWCVACGVSCCVVVPGVAVH